MVAKTQRTNQDPPDWWNVSLYKFFKDMPLKGWVWEFMRRARLKKVFGIQPVEAMRPITEYQSIPKETLLLYEPWHDGLHSSSGPVTLPPAVTIKNERTWYTNEPYRIDGYEDKDWAWISDPIKRQEVDVTIDLNRWDKVILADFVTALKKLRKQQDPPEQIYPRPEDWEKNHILEVWDLKEFNIRPFKIRDKIPLDSLDSVRNAYRTAKTYIDEEKWKKLALYCEAEE